MPFTRISKDDSYGDSFKYLLLTDNEASTSGEALTLSSGRLTKCGSTTTPEYIAVGTQAAETTSVTPIAVIHVTENTLYECKSSGQIAASAIGNKYTIASDGLGITTTTTNGVFEVVETDGASVSTVRGYFRR